MRLSPLTRFIPSLNEVVVHVSRARTSKLDVHVVHSVLAVIRSYHRLSAEIDAAHERDLTRLSGVDQPTLLMLTIQLLRAIPARGEQLSDYQV